VALTSRCVFALLQVNRSLSFQVKRLPVCDLVPEEMQGMWAMVSVHFKAALSAAELVQVAELFGASGAGSALSRQAPGALPVMPEPTELPALKGLGPLLPVGTHRVVLPEATETASKKTEDKSGKKGDDCCGGQPINVAIRIGGSDNAKEAKAIVVSQGKEKKDEMSA
jgi:hypothetical protein